MIKFNMSDFEFTWQHLGWMKGASVETMKITCGQKDEQEWGGTRTGGRRSFLSLVDSIRLSQLLQTSAEHSLFMKLHIWRTSILMSQ